MKVTVNGTDFELYVDFLRYQDIVILSGWPPDEDGLAITYEAGKRRGTVQPGRSIDIEDGMVFDAVRCLAA